MSAQNADDTADSNAPRLLADLDSYLAQADEGQRGALWRLAEPARQLDANLVRLPPNAEVDVHREPDVDVLVVAVAGHGTVHAESGAVELSAHCVAWMPRGSSRSITAGPDGFSYLTVHRARTGMRIRPAGS
jgi:quercetin dioxygenase-like cupin family protein